MSIAVDGPFNFNQPVFCRDRCLFLVYELYSYASFCVHKVTDFGFSAIGWTTGNDP